MALTKVSSIARTVLASPLSQVSQAESDAGEHVVYFARLLAPDGTVVNTRTDALRLGVEHEFDHVGQLCRCMDQVPGGPDGFPPMDHVRFLNDGFETWAYQEELADRPC